MKLLAAISLTFIFLATASCMHSLSMHAKDGETLTGNWRFGREDTGSIRVLGSDGEVLAGRFVRVGQRAFVESYEKTFGRGTIAVDGPDMSNFGGLVITSTTLMDVAYGESLNIDSGNAPTRVAGPLFYWTASLQGDRGSTLGCYLIGSSYTGHGFGRCRSHSGKEYSARF